ncbi:MAG: PEGA domain-containing protein [Candidatus Dojkabacteria bacterium]|nr:PEGA domain-containing protein [Candidatus Dojkabacteria bacterium]
MNGTIRFDSSPSNVEVSLNGKYVGLTPLDITDVIPGDYSYELRKEKHEYLGKLDVYPGKITLISANFIVNSIFKDYIEIPSSNNDSVEDKQEKSNENQHQRIEEKSEQDKQFTENSQPLKESILINESQNSVLSEHLSEMNEILNKNNEILTELNKGINLLSEHEMETSGYNLERRYFTTGELAIRVATPNKPETSDIVADPNTTPPTTGYDRIAIFDAMLRRSPDVAVVNDGSTNLYIVISHDGKVFSTSEVTLMRGEIKHFYNIYELRIRGPAVGNLDPDVGEQPGGLYRATEYPSRFDFFNVNKSAIAVATAAPVLAIGVGFTTFTIVGDIINLTSAFRSRVTNTDNIYYASAGQDITNDAQRGILAPGDVLIVNGTRGMQINFAGNSPGQAIEATTETDLV